MSRNDVAQIKLLLPEVIASSMCRSSLRAAWLMVVISWMPLGQVLPAW